MNNNIDWKKLIIPLLTALANMVGKGLNLLDPDNKIKRKVLKQSKYADKALHKVNQIFGWYELMTDYYSMVIEKKKKFSDVEKDIRRLSKKIRTRKKEYYTLLVKE